MKQFIRGVLTDSDGNPSSKRVVMFLIVFLFIAMVVVNLTTGKDVEITLKNQVFYILCWIISTVIGEKVINIFNPKGDTTK